MKQLSLLGIFALFAQIVNAGTPVTATIRNATPEILKISWPSSGDHKESFVVWSAPSVSGPWKKFSVEHSQDYVTRRSVVAGESQRYYKVTQRSAKSVGPEVTNLIVNGDLEVVVDGLPVGWAKGGYGSNNRTFTFPVEGPDGTNDRACELTVSDHIDGDAKWFFTEVAVICGETYAFENSYLSTAPTVITLQVHDTSGGFAYKDIGFLPASTEWTNSYTEFTAPTNAAHVTIFHRLAMNGTLATDNSFLYRVERPSSSLSEGVVSINLDDGWRDAFLEATNVLGRAGIPATFYIIAGETNGHGYISQAEVLALQSLRHEVGAHTLTHADLTAVSYVQQEREINLSRQVLLNLGITNVWTFAHTYGVYNPQLQTLVREAGFSGARGVEEGINQKGTTDLFGLQSIDMNADTTLEEVKVLIDRAIADKGWLTLVFHHINNLGNANGDNLYCVTPEFFRAVVDYIKQVGIKTVTAAEGVRLLQAP